jgi:hypothetical protein
MMTAAPQNAPRGSCAPKSIDRTHAVIEFVAAAVVRLVKRASPPDIAAEKSCLIELELPPHASLSVPAGEDPALDAIKVGERHEA